MLKIIDKPKQGIEVQFEDSEAGRISWVRDTGDGMYLIQSYRIRYGEYGLYDVDYAPNHACAVVRARHFVETGTIV